MAEEPTPDNPIASLGGKARAAKLSAAERKESARKAAEARWHGDALKATHGSPDHPLVIGGIAIPCYVLEDGQRVIVQTGMIQALGMAKGGSSHRGGTRLAKFVSGNRLKDLVTPELIEGTRNPLKFITTAGTFAFGFRGEILADICEAVLEAKKRGILQAQQEHIADQCWILYRGFARVGIIALIDEATGYQDARARDALAKILEAFVAKELQKWVRTFPAGYYEELFRLRKLTYTGASKRPGYIGHLTNDLIYARLAPGVLEELRKKNPVIPEKGHRKSKHFQWLTPDMGHPRLRMHLEGVIVAMKLSKDWKEFYGRLNELYPKMNETPMLPGMRYDEAGENGAG